MQENQNVMIEKLHKITLIKKEKFYYLLTF